VPIFLTGNGDFRKGLALYSEIYLEHFQNPHNVGTIDEPTAYGEAKVERVSYEVDFYLIIENDIIVESKFKAMGCSAAIASSSALTVLIQDKTIEQAEQIDIEVLTDYLETVPVSKIECCVLALDALQNALADYRSQQ
jgi:nitrogen fixation protein NifU and related proteins